MEDESLDVLISPNLDQSQEEYIEAMERFAAQMMAHFSGHRKFGARESAA